MYNTGESCAGRLCSVSSPNLVEELEHARILGVEAAYTAEEADAIVPLNTIWWPTTVTQYQQMMQIGDTGMHDKAWQESSGHSPRRTIINSKLAQQ